MDTERSKVKIDYLHGFGEVVPNKEWITNDGYRWFIFTPKQTGITLICLEDCTTGVVLSSPLARPDSRVAAHKAWGGARQSRAAGAPWDIYAEMVQKDVDPQKKAEEMFVGYGHKSVGDMADMMRDAHLVPMHYCLAEFNNMAVNAGQEKSTRYQIIFSDTPLFEARHFLPKSIEGRVLEEVEAEYQALGRLALGYFAKYRVVLEQPFSEHFQPNGVRQRASLSSRVLDCARFFVLMGQRTAMSNKTSARDWSRWISELKSSPMPLYRRMGDHMVRFFAPTETEEDFLGAKAEAPSLIRHTETNDTTNRNLAELKRFVESETGLLNEVPPMNMPRGEVAQKVSLLPREYTEGDKMVAQYFLTLWPGLNSSKLLEWVHTCADDVKQKISAIILKDHHCNNELGVLATTRGITLVYKAAMGEERDYNRHRAWGRFIPLPLVFGLPVDYKTAKQILNKGYHLPLYLSEMPEFSLYGKMFSQDMKDYYEKARGFMDRLNQRFGDSIDYSIVINLLPMAHNTEMWMHGDPKGASYLPDRRRRPGGHVNYIGLAEKANILLTESDPYLSALRFEESPQPFSRKEFFDRG